MSSFPFSCLSGKMKKIPGRQKKNYDDAFNSGNNLKKP